MQDASEPPSRDDGGLLSLLARWRLLLASLCLLTIFALRQTGALPGQVIRISDVLLVALVLGLTMSAAHARRRTQILQGAIAALAVGLAIVGVAIASVDVQRIASGVTAFVLAAAIFFVFRALIAQRRVSADTFFGAFAGYLAVGVMFAMIYTIIARGDPAAFEPPQPVLDGQSDLYYFSFVTLTTLGYGDIAPLANNVRVLAPIEAILGAIIIAGLVGRVVGLLVAQAPEGDAPTRTESPE